MVNDLFIGEKIIGVAGMRLSFQKREVISVTGLRLPLQKRKIIGVARLRLPLQKRKVIGVADEAPASEAKSRSPLGLADLANTRPLNCNKRTASSIQSVII